MNERDFQAQAESIANIAFIECDGDLDAAMDYIHETCDGHEWVIYYYKALKICADCNVQMGEMFLEEIGVPENPTIGSIASIIVYAELRGRAEAHLMMKNEEAA
jgi:hypothetical protein